MLTWCFLVVIRASGNSTFTCPDIFSLARIILLKVFNKTLVARRTTLSFSVARGDQTTAEFEPCTDITVHKSLLNGWKEFFYLMMHSTHFYVRLFGVWYVVKDHSEVRKENPLPPHGLLFPISSKESFICTIPQTAFVTPVVEHWLEQEVAQGSQLEDQSSDFLNVSLKKKSI